LIYLYCLLGAASEPPAGLVGVDETPVRAIGVGGLGAWVSDVSGTSMAASPARARDHDRVVRSALERETPLPARFGQIVADVGALTEMVASRRAALESALDSVSGSVEMTVRVLLPPGDTRATGPQPDRGERREITGRAYLERAAAEQRRERNVLALGGIVRERVSSAVQKLVRAEAFAGAQAGSSMATLAHLVPRENVEAYRSALLQLRDEEPTLAIMVSGPWAPYSFTEVGA
jgi:alkylhydroperoxidase/carboxymuconolactone decarboxylase family protein YurZ